MFIEPVAQLCFQWLLHAEDYLNLSALLQFSSAFWFIKHCFFWRWRFDQTCWCQWDSHAIGFKGGDSSREAPENSKQTWSHIHRIFISWSLKLKKMIANHVKDNQFRDKLAHLLFIFKIKANINSFKLFIYEYFDVFFRDIWFFFTSIKLSGNPC